jgi:regulator of protease activity HflC (stomatin/prohibitin superfamily)
MILDQAIFVIAVAAWAALLGIILIVLIRTAQSEGLITAVRRILNERLIVLLLVFAVIVTLISNAVVYIEPQQVGIVSSLIAPRGYRDQPLDSGLQLIVPLVERVHRFPTYLQTYTISSVRNETAGAQVGNISARTSDGQAVYVEVSLIYGIDRANAVRVYLDWQDRYVSDLISPLVRGVVRAHISQFTVDQVNSDMRQRLEEQIAAAMTDELDDYGFTVRRFLLRDISFSPQFANAVEEKQVAFQGVARDQYRAQQLDITSRADALALERLGAAISQNPDVVLLRYIEKLAPTITTLLVPSNSPFVLPLPDAFSRSGARVPTPGTPPTPTPTP